MNSRIHLFLVYFKIALFVLSRLCSVEWRSDLWMTNWNARETKWSWRIFILWRVDPFLGNALANTFPRIEKWKIQILVNQFVAVESTGVSMDTSNQKAFPRIFLRYTSCRSYKNQVNRKTIVKSLSVVDQTRMEPVRIEQVRLQSYCELLKLIVIKRF
jgi:hypothetical protein